MENFVRGRRQGMNSDEVVIFKPEAYCSFELAMASQTSRLEVSGPVICLARRRYPSNSAVAQPFDDGCLAPLIARDRPDPRRMRGRRLGLEGFGFRRRRQLGDGGVGRALVSLRRGSSTFTCQRPSGAFSISSCAPMRLNLSLVVDKPAPTTFASEAALRPGRSRIAARSFRSAARAWAGLS